MLSKEFIRKHVFVTYAYPPAHNPTNKPFCKYCGIYLSNSKNIDCIKRTEDYTPSSLGLVYRYELKEGGSH